MDEQNQANQQQAARARKAEELAQAQLALAALASGGEAVAPELFQFLGRPPMHRVEAGEGYRLEIRQVGGTLPGPLAFWQGENLLHFLLWKRVVTIVLPRRAMLGQAAAHIGLMLAQTEAMPQPFLVYLVLAYLALTREPPAPVQLQLMRAIADPADGNIPPMSEQLATRDLRQLVLQEFADLEGETIHLPVGLWNTARGLVITGEHAWQLKGKQAQHWGSFPTYSPVLWDVPQRQRLQLAVLAGMMATPQIFARLPLPPMEGADPEEVWLDYISLAGGTGTPDRFLRPLGLGAFGTSALENNPEPHRLALSRTHGQALSSIAAAVLASASDRPARYSGRVFSLDVPHELLPQLRPWGIEGLVVQVEPGGMYVSVRDGDGRSMAAGWWEASPDSSLRTPLTYTPASWVLLHPIWASVWHDLKADAVVLHKPDLQTAGQTVVRGQHKQSKQRGQSTRPRQKIYLPPVRVVTRAQWASDAERRTLRQATAGGHGYRRLPPGWEEREQLALHQYEQHGGSMPGILRRREEAARRAQAHDYPPPPPGFTYVAPYLRGGKQPEGTPAIPSVRAKGLFSLVLGLQVNAVEPLNMDQEPGTA